MRIHQGFLHEDETRVKGEKTRLRVRARGRRGRGTERAYSATWRRRPRREVSEHTFLLES